MYYNTFSYVKIRILKLLKMEIVKANRSTKLQVTPYICKLHGSFS